MKNYSRTKIPQQKHLFTTKPQRTGIRQKNPTPTADQDENVRGKANVVSSNIACAAVASGSLNSVLMMPTVTLPYARTEYVLETKYGKPDLSS